VRPTDLLRWRLCLLLALCCSAYAVWASAAAAFPIENDLAAAQARLPEGHPCKAPGSIDVLFVDGLRSGTATEDGEAPIGVLIDGHWYSRSAATGELMPLACWIGLDRTGWARSSSCDRRRLVTHEVEHLGSLLDGTGIMSPYADQREHVAVPGCPAILEALRDRITGAVLERVPRGWEVSCGPRRDCVIRCIAEHGRRRRAYRARLHDQVGTSFTVVRVKLK
jgi:hypothetical protein